MYIFIIVLVIVVCVLLTLAILIQNPKGGGLSAGFGGMGNQVMGARRANDFIEKTTWTLVVSLLVLSLVSGIFMPKSSGERLPESEIEKGFNQTPVIPDQQPQTMPQQPSQQQQQPVEETAPLEQPAE